MKEIMKTNEYYIPYFMISKNENDTSNDTSGIILKIPNNQILNL